MDLHLSTLLIFHLDGAGGRTRGAGRKEFHERGLVRRPTRRALDCEEPFLQRVLVELERSSSSVQAVLSNQFQRRGPQRLRNG
jgi:hypothetical protein